MPSRRTALTLLGAALGGCLARNSSTQTGTSEAPGSTPTSKTASPHDSPTGQAVTDVNPGTPDDWPPEEWTPSWSLDVPGTHVLGVDRDGDALLVTASSQRSTTVLALDPTSRERLWAADLDGDALGGSIPDGNHARRWGVTVVGDTVLVVTEPEAGRPPTVLHGLDRATGEHRWSLERDEQLRIRGVVDGTVYVHGEYVSRTPTDHVDYGTGASSPTPTPKPSSVYAVNVADGAVEWSTTLDGIRTVRVDASGVYLTVMNRLVAYDLNGTQRWSVSGDHLSRSLHVTDGGVFFVTMPDWSRSVVSYVTADGAERWTERVRADETTLHDGALYAAGRGMWRLGADGVEWHRNVYAGWPTFGPTGERLYVRTGVQADAVAALSATDGRFRWAFDPPISNAWAECATADSVVAGAIGDAGRPLYRVDAESGTPTGRYTGLDPLVVTAVGDTVFLGSGSHEPGAARLLAFEA